MAMEYSELVVVFVGAGWRAGMVLGLLQDAGIEAYLNDESMGTLAPWNTGAPISGAVKVVVPHSELVNARLIVDDFLKNSGVDEV